MGDLPISFRENRTTAGLFAFICAGFGLVTLWFHHSYTTQPSAWPNIRHPGSIPYFAALMEISCLWRLRWSLPALILAPTFFEIREGGLQFVRFGFVPWSSIGRIWLMAYSTGPAQGSERTSLYIEVTDLPNRIRVLPWWSRIERSLLTLGTKPPVLLLPDGRLTQPLAEVAALIEAHRPKAKAEVSP